MKRFALPTKPKELKLNTERNFKSENKNYRNGKKEPFETFIFLMLYL